MGTSEEWYLRWRARDDGMVELDGHLDRRTGEVVQRALDAACAELDRRYGPVPGGWNAATPEAARRRADGFALVIKRAMEVGFDSDFVAQFLAERDARRGGGEGTPGDADGPSKRYDKHGDVSHDKLVLRDSSLDPDAWGRGNPMASVAPRLDRAELVIEWAHDTLGLTYEEIGDAVGTTGRTVLRWRDRRHAPQRRNEAQIEKLDELRFWLGTVFAEDHEAADAWLRTRLLEFRGKTPLAMVKRGDLDRVIEMLATYEAGAFV